MKWLFLKGETTNQFGIGNDENGHNNAISIQAEQSNNAIIINEPMAIIQMLKKVIHQWDVRPDQVFV
ncbi:secretin N-terminal domain-containing protein [Candidatus Coxiella mudrowiae]|uniref:secretin N-terminal domain-containing protein n=1 Tax=Candidatus Coxiella mudrowiae TaxID=2054173 RepID=UPI0006621852|nr:secretin N-terminal domain-containing protein [Candidatus Coxiella mudrowiae]